jgi:hypothetical protein
MNFFMPCYLNHTNQLYGKFPKAYFATFGKSIWAHAVLGARNYFQSAAGI